MARALPGCTQREFTPRRVRRDAVLGGSPRLAGEQVDNGDDRRQKDGGEHDQDDECGQEHGFT